MWFSKKAPSAEQLVANIEATVADIRRRYINLWSSKSNTGGVFEFSPEVKLRGTHATMLFESTVQSADTARERVEKTVIRCRVVGLPEAMIAEVAALLRTKPWPKDVYGGSIELEFGFTVS